MTQQERRSPAGPHLDKVQGRWMALDVGSKTIGVAISDVLRITVRPLETLLRRELDEDADAVAELIRREEVKRLIVGLPRHLDGRKSKVLEHIRPLAEAVGRRTSVPVDWHDERLSTKEAETLMAEKKLPLGERRRKRNEYAAALILRWYLEEHVH